MHNVWSGRKVLSSPCEFIQFIRLEVRGNSKLRYKIVQCVGLEVIGRRVVPVWDYRGLWDLVL